MSENKNKKSIAIIPDERIIGKIYYLRGKKVYPHTNYVLYLYPKK